MPAPDESRCAQMTFSPHIADVGDLIEASAGPITSECGGPSTSVRYGWPVPDQATGELPGLVQAHRCPVNALHCEYRAVMFTQLGIWNGLCITGTSPDGGWSCCESYVVRVGPYLRLTDPIRGLNGKSVVVHLSGAGVRETATTDSDTFWQFAVRKGTYKVSFRWHGKTVRRTVKVRGRRSANVEVPALLAELPTAMHAVTDLHDTPFRTLTVAPLGLVMVGIDQLVPFQLSANVL